MPTHASHPQLPARLDALVRRSGGVVRIADLVRCGASSAESDWPPVWRKLLPGVVFTAERTPSVRDRRRAALRYAGPGALLTGLTALRLHGVRRLPAEWEVHLLTPPHRRKLSTAYVVIQRSARRMPAHRWKDGLPCTLPARAVVDAVRRLKGADVIRSLLSQASAHQRCTLLELAEELRLADGRGLRLPRQVFGEFCSDARTAARDRLRTMLERARLPPAVWEPALPGSPVAWWPERDVAVTLDTSGWALTPGSALAARRDCYRLSKHHPGLTVIRVVPEELTCRPATVLATVSTAVLTPATSSWREQRKECA